MLCVVHDGVTYVAPEEIAKRWNCSPRHVRNLVSRGELPGRRFGSIVRVRVSDLEQYEQAALVHAAPAPVPKPRAVRTAETSLPALDADAWVNLRKPQASKRRRNFWG